MIIPEALERTNFSQSQSLKLLGFDSWCSYIWSDETTLEQVPVHKNHGWLKNSLLSEESAVAPQFPELLRWLRNQYDFTIKIRNVKDQKNTYSYALITSSNFIVIKGIACENPLLYQPESLILDAAIGYLTLDKQFNRIK